MSASWAELGVSCTRVSASSTVRSLRQQDGQAEEHAAGLDRDHPRYLVEHIERVAGDPGHHRIGIAARDHAGGEDIAVLVHQALAVAIEHALALLALVEKIGIALVVVRQPRIVDFETLRANSAPSPPSSL